MDPKYLVFCVCLKKEVYSEIKANIPEPNDVYDSFFQIYLYYKILPVDKKTYESMFPVNLAIYYEYPNGDLVLDN